MKTKIITDSGSGLSQAQAEALGIGLLPLQVSVDGETYLDGVNLDAKKLFALMEEGKMPTTSQPPLLLQEEMFEEFDKEGVTDLILINLSGGLSSTNATLQATARRFGLNVHTLDIFTTLFVQKYLTLAAVQLLEAGKSPEEIIAILKKAVDGSSGYLIVEDLGHLAAGGRLTPMAAKLGNMLKIKPILEVSQRTEGKVDVHSKVRTMNKAIKNAVEQIRQEADPNQEYILFMLNGGNESGVDTGMKALKEAFGEDLEVHIDPMYPVIACHTGLGSVGFQYIPKIEGVEIQ